MIRKSQQLIRIKLYLFFKLTLVFLIGGLEKPIYAAAGGAEHVVIVGCDGMSPNGILNANTPVMDQLMKEGAYTLHARGVLPTYSSPNWASMIMGAGPEQHGVTSNNWETNRFQIAPTAVGSGGMFPTIFGVLREQRPQSVIACFHDWSEFGRLFERNAADMIENSDGPTNAVQHAIAYIKQKKPTFLFIHLDHVDHVGHAIGHGTPEYFAAVEVADKLIGEVIQGLKEAGIWNKTILLVTADHGGVKKKHGNATMEEIEIPWIMVGPGVVAGKELKQPVNTYDTAVTVAYIFGLQPPQCWIGKPVKDAFNSD
jgi:predicted AlkP superfamily pyrophosphatase or phosphodiesterase